jgi:ketosteroid isomerase-like protein
VIAMATGPSTQDASIREAIDRHWAASNAGDDETEGEIDCEDVKLEYHQSGAHFRGRHNVLDSRGNNPARRRFEVQRVVGSGNLWVTEYVFFYDERPIPTVSIMEFRDGKVAHETQYFADPFEAPAWRARWRDVPIGRSVGS